MVDNYAARTVRGVRGILMQSFDLANQLGLMQGNPAVGVKLPKIRRRGPKDERYGCWLIRLDSFVFTNRKTRKPYTYTGFRAVYYHCLERNGLKACHLNLHSYRSLYELRNKYQNTLIRIIFAYTSKENVVLLEAFIKNHKRKTDVALAAALDKLRRIENNPTQFLLEVDIRQWIQE